FLPHRHEIRPELRTFKTGLADIITDLKRTHIIIEISKTLLDVNTSPDMLLDVNTANNKLIVSSDLKTVSWAKQSQKRPETPERFVFYPQVLGIGGFTSGRHYWEVETRGVSWIIGMIYGIQLRLLKNMYSVLSNGTVTELKCRQSVPRIRIYLDYEAGQLSFYELSDPHKHIHTFTARFTEPLHVAICVWGMPR
uniref:B30.2/SPRY domain-containing protein n=1 Tax=Leptobrachium leishanense TaxID=445787 RepID=A0A8C5QYN2_9ANUR